ncbi:MAG: SDR family NAD(P)-dependent oxidoreductase [Saprospiraceae bacterium]|nr:SDR family NAD(P)-dependent oxidoreductase [Saprospiraceae bacterium]
MQELKEQIALVTGASRGIGKGIAIALAKCGAFVYITGRTETEGETATSLSGSIGRTEAEILSLGGKCKAIRCDHTNDLEVQKVFEQIFAEQGQLDILVNSVWGGYEHYNDGTEFWLEEGFWASPLSRWDKMFSAGVRAAYVASSIAAKRMIERKAGMIFNLSYWASQRNDMGVAYGTAKAATDKMTAAMAHELRPHNIPVICLYPGLVRTEAVLQAQDHFDLSNSESPEFVGRVISRLATDPAIMDKSGQVLIAATVAIAYEVKDIDGKQPRPLTRNEA